MLYMGEEAKTSSHQDNSPRQHCGLQHRRYHAQPFVERASLNTMGMELSGGHSFGGTSRLAVRRSVKQGTTTEEADGVKGGKRRGGH